MIIILIIATIILGEIIGLLLSNASEKSERDAYLYNGAALVIEDDNGGFTKSDYDEIRKVKYVTGLGGVERADCRSGGYRECKGT